MKGDKKPIDNLISLDSFDEQKNDQGYNNVLNEIAELKKTISATPSSATTGMGGAEGRVGIMSDGSEQKLLALTEEILRCSKQMMSKFSDDIADLRGRIQKLDGNSCAGYENKATARVNESDANSVSIIKEMYAVKDLIGSSSPTDGKRNAEVLAVYEMLDNVYYNVVNDDVDMLEKFESVDALAKVLEKNSSYDVLPVVDALNSYVEKLEALPLDKQRTQSVIAFTEKNQSWLISSSKKEMINAYMATVESKIKDGGVESIDALPDVIALKNDIQHGKYEYENELKYSDILNKNIMLLGERDIVKNKNLRSEIKEKIQALVALEVKDLFLYPPVKIKFTYLQPKEVEKESLSQKIDQLKAYVADLVLPQTVTVDGAIGVGIASEINALKKEIASLNNTDYIKKDVDEIKAKCDAILSQAGENDGACTVMSKTDGSSVSLNEIVIQLDRLFDDVKVIVEDGEQKTEKAIAEAKAELQAKEEENSNKLNEIGAVIVGVKDTLETEKKVLGEEMGAIKTKAEEIFACQGEIKTAIIEAQSTEMAMLTNAVAELSANVIQLKEQAENSVRSNARCMGEIEKLRDQMFAINMLEVSGEENKYDSYNNVIFDELCALRDDFDKFNDSVQNGEVNGDVIKVVENVLENTDVIKARLQIADEAKDSAVNVQNTLESKEQLSKSLEDLKQELSKLVEDIKG